MAPNHYLNWRLILIGKVLWHSPKSNFIAIVQATVLYTEFENNIFENSNNHHVSQAPVSWNMAW